MTNKGEKPILQFSILCDAFSSPEGEKGKPTLIGIFNHLVRPTTIPQFFVVNRWINGIGEHSQVIKILDPELTEIHNSGEQKFSLASKVNAADVIYGIVNMPFPKPGVYWIKIELNGKTALAYPLPVKKG